MIDKIIDWFKIDKRSENPLTTTSSRYDNVTDASIDLDLRESSIVAVANGSRNQHKGFHFIYIIEN